VTLERHILTMRPSPRGDTLRAREDTAARVSRKSFDSCADAAGTHVGTVRGIGKFKEEVWS